MVKKSRILKNYSLTPQKRKSNNLSKTNLMFGVQISKIMEIVVLIANFDQANLIVFVVGAAVSPRKFRLRGMRDVFVATYKVTERHAIFKRTDKIHHGGFVV